MSEGYIVAIITALGTFVVAVFGAIISVVAARSSSQKAELESLVVTVSQLRDENIRLGTKLAAYEARENDWATQRAQRDKRISDLEREVSNLKRRLENTKPLPRPPRKGGG